MIRRLANSSGFFRNLDLSLSHCCYFWQGWQCYSKKKTEWPPPKEMFGICSSGLLVFFCFAFFPIVRKINSHLPPSGGLQLMLNNGSAWFILIAVQTLYCKLVGLDGCCRRQHIFRQRSLTEQNRHHGNLLKLHNQTLESFPNLSRISARSKETSSSY